MNFFAKAFWRLLSHSFTPGEGRGVLNECRRWLAKERSTLHCAYIEHNHRGGLSGFYHNVLALFCLVLRQYC